MRKNMKKYKICDSVNPVLFENLSGFIISFNFEKNRHNIIPPIWLKPPKRCFHYSITRGILLKKWNWWKLTLLCTDMQTYSWDLIYILRFHWKLEARVCKWDMPTISSWHPYVAYIGHVPGLRVTERILADPDLEADINVV